MIDPSTSTKTTRSAKGRVLVSGASFAGLATAFWMDRLGFDVTIVEVAKGIRRGGTPVDIEGETIAILQRMGLFEAVRDKVLPPRVLAFKDAHDRTLGTVDHDRSSADRDEDRTFEIHRDDLLDILLQAVAGSAEMIFDRSITHLDQHADGVGVTLSDGSRREVAFVFGCDGNRSNTRRLLFGDGDDASYFMGGYFYLKVVAETGLLPADMSEMYSEPGRTAMLNGYVDRTDICFAFWTGEEIDYDHRDRAAIRQMLHDRFDGLGWKVPAMLAHVDEPGELYFDWASQIRLPGWSKGRVALVGDAGYCVSPVAGMGGSMAIIGAARLGEAMAKHPDDHAAAFDAYEDGLRDFVGDVQERAATTGIATILPADVDQLAERNRQIARREIAL